MTSARLPAEKPFQHHGNTGEVIAIATVNLLLSIVTLSLWRFWGKARVRRFLWSQTTAWGDPLEYTGTGGELFRGFLAVLLLVFLPLSVAIGLLQAQAAAGAPAAVLGVFVIQLAFFVLAGAGLYRAYRYQLTRTRWRGIGANLNGSAWNYGAMILGTSLVTSLTLGWGLPWAQMRLMRYRLDNTVFGDLPFRCDARARPLYKRFAVVWLVAVVTMFAALGLGAILAAADMDQETRVIAGLIYGGAVVVVVTLTVGLAYAWYKAAFYRELAAHTRFDSQAFGLTIGSWPLIRLVLGNWMISLLSLGILAPWAAVRTFRFACRHLEISGQPDFSRVGQGAADQSRLGEGLATVFDGAGAF